MSFISATVILVKKFIGMNIEIRKIKIRNILLSFVCIYEN